MSIAMFIEYNNQIIQFPVNPFDLKRVKDSNNTTTDIVELGEINQLGLTKLAECQIDSFLPARANHSFVLTKGDFKNPNFYIDFLEKIRTDRKPCRFIVTQTKINMLASVESFDYEYKGGDGDVHFKLDLKEFKNHSAKEVKVNLVGQIPSGVSNNTQNNSTSQKIGIGSTVIVNGRLHRDSFGAGPGLTEKNAVRKINFHKPGRSHPYHVTLLNGGWRGWVTAGSVRLQ